MKLALLRQLPEFTSSTISWSRTCHGTSGMSSTIRKMQLLYMTCHSWQKLEHLLLMKKLQAKCEAKVHLRGIKAHGADNACDTRHNERRNGKMRKEASKVTFSRSALYLSGKSVTCQSVCQPAACTSVLFFFVYNTVNLFQARTGVGNNRLEFTNECVYVSRTP